MDHELLHIDATPDATYPIRILQAYRRLGDTVWSSTSMELDESHPLVKDMNEAQEKRNILLDKAIDVLLSAYLQQAHDAQADKH